MIDTIPTHAEPHPLLFSYRGSSNIRISVLCNISKGGVIKYNQSGLAKDSSVYGFRIA